MDTYKQAIASGELDKMPPLAPAPPMPEVLAFHRSEPDDYYCRPSLRRLPAPVAEIGATRAREGLRHSVIQLTAQAGFVTAQRSAVALLTDATELYLEDVCARLRRGLDHSLELAPGHGNGWSDVLEKVVVEMGVRSQGPGGGYQRGLLALGEYYEERVVGGQARAVAQCREREARYQSELPGEAGSWPSQDEIPEMHFPSSDEGAGLEGDHATPTLDVGMQMLQVSYLPLTTLTFPSLWRPPETLTPPCRWPRARP